MKFMRMSRTVYVQPLDVKVLRCCPSRARVYSNENMQKAINSAKALLAEKHDLGGFEHDIVCFTKIAKERLHKKFGSRIANQSMIKALNFFNADTGNVRNYRSDRGQFIAHNIVSNEDKLNSVAATANKFLTTTEVDTILAMVKGNVRE